VAGTKIGRSGLLHSDTFLHVSLLFFNSHAAAGIYEMASSIVVFLQFISLPCVAASMADD